MDLKRFSKLKHLLIAAIFVAGSSLQAPTCIIANDQNKCTYCWQGKPDPTTGKCIAPVPADNCQAYYITSKAPIVVGCGWCNEGYALTQDWKCSPINTSAQIDHCKFAVITSENNLKCLSCKPNLVDKTTLYPTLNLGKCLEESPEQAVANCVQGARYQVGGPAVCDACGPEYVLDIDNPQNCDPTPLSGCWYENDNSVCLACEAFDGYAAEYDIVQKLMTCTAPTSLKGVEGGVKKGRNPRLLGRGRNGLKKSDMEVIRRVVERRFEIFGEGNHGGAKPHQD